MSRGRYLYQVPWFPSIRGDVSGSTLLGWPPEFAKSPTRWRVCCRVCFPQNLGGLRKKVCHLFVNIVHAALYRSPLWAEAAAEVEARSKFGLLRTAQRVVALRVMRGYRAVVTETAGVLARVRPLVLLARMYSTRYFRRVKLLQEGLAKDALRKALANSER